MSRSPAPSDVHTRATSCKEGPASAAPTPVDPSRASLAPPLSARATPTLRPRAPSRSESHPPLLFALTHSSCPPPHAALVKVHSRRQWPWQRNGDWRRRRPPLRLPAGYRVALISRPRKEVDDLRDEIERAGGTAAVFGLERYDYESVGTVFDRVQAHWPDGRLKCAVWNTAQW